MMISKNLIMRRSARHQSQVAVIPTATAVVEVVMATTKFDAVELIQIDLIFQHKVARNLAVKAYDCCNGTIKDLGACDY